jgi:hypothetical protein
LGNTWTPLGQVVGAIPTTGAWASNSIDDVTRAHVYVNPSPLNPNNKYVLWCHADNAEGGYVVAKAAYATAPTRSGPYVWGSTLYSPAGGQGCHDTFLFSDPPSGGLYLIHSNEANTAVYCSQLDPTTDYTSFTGTFFQVGPSTREAPVLIYKPPYYYLITSQDTDYGSSNTQLKYRSATSLAGLVSASDSSIWTSAPASTDAAYNAQSTSIVGVPGRPGDYLFVTDEWDTGAGTSFVLSLARMGLYPVPVSHLNAGALTVDPKLSWVLDTEMPPVPPSRASRSRKSPNRACG